MWRRLLVVGIVCLVVGVFTYGSDIGAMCLMFGVLLTAAGAVLRLLNPPAARHENDRP